MVDVRGKPSSGRGWLDRLARRSLRLHVDVDAGGEQGCGDGRFETVTEEVQVARPFEGVRAGDLGRVL